MSALLLGDYETHSDEWYATRRMGIGGSDIPAILGISKWRTPLEVYYDKRGELPQRDAGEAADWGNLLEDVVAQEWARRNGYTVGRIGTLAREDAPWQLVNLDREVGNCTPGKACFLEVKTRNAWDAGNWREEIPDDVLAQVQWGIHVSGADHAHVAALIGGQRLVDYRVERDEDVIAYCVEKAGALWARIQLGDPPFEDPGALLTKLLDRLHPDRTGQKEVDPEQVASWRRVYAAAAEAEKAASEGKETAKAALVEMLGDAAEAVAPGDKPRTLFTYRPDLRRSVDWKRLAQEYPDAYKTCVERKPTRPILRFKNEKESA